SLQSTRRLPEILTLQCAASASDAAHSLSRGPALYPLGLINLPLPFLPHEGVNAGEDGAVRVDEEDLNGGMIAASLPRAVLHILGLQNAAVVRMRHADELLQRPMLPEGGGSMAVSRGEIGRAESGKLLLH